MQAVGLLTRLGHQGLRHYSGGMEEWVEQGEPVESGPPRLGVPPRAPATAREAVRPPPLRPGQGLGSALERLIDRPFGFLLGLWLAQVLVCGLGFWLLVRLLPPGLLEQGRPLDPGIGGLPTSLYFSFVTATSVGFGDVIPVGIARILAIAESAWSLLLFGCIISKLVSRRQEAQIEEIHRTTFEERLLRARGDLHRVLADLDAIAAELGSGGPPSPRILARVESVARVFAGELRLIHDLLFGARQQPHEADLEALLAGVAAGLQALGDLLRGLDHEPPPTGLGATLAEIRRLAGEICGDCVPRRYQDSLHEWMDRIRALAAHVSPADGQPQPLFDSSSPK